MRQSRADAGGHPWCVQPELVEGCTRLCSFCGLRAIRDKPGDFRYMTLDTAAVLANGCRDFCPQARVEFALRGEPLVHPHHLEIFQLFRHAMPRCQLMVTTNGDTLRGRMQRRVDLMFDAGLNFVLLDTYYPEPARTALRNEALALHGVTVVDFFAEWLPAGKSPYSNHGRSLQRTVVLMDDLAARDGEHGSRLVKTHAGANLSKPLLPAPLVRSCARPFREIIVTWNGDVTLCCDDWRKQYIIGNIHERTLPDLWQDPRYETARARLYHRDRDFIPCRYCDAPGAPRFGLLPRYDPLPDTRDE